MHDESAGNVAMTKHALVIAGGGPTGLMLAGELALSRIDVAIVERRENQELVGSRAGALHSRTIEVLDQARPVSSTGQKWEDSIESSAHVSLPSGPGIRVC